MKPGFEKFNHFVTFITLLIAILKIIIFINNIDMTKKIAIYLQDQLFARLYNKVNIFI